MILWRPLLWLQGKTTDVWWPFIICTEDSRTGGVDSIDSCADSTEGIDTDLLNVCYQGPEGDDLLAAAGVVTDNLDPPHEYTPWVILEVRAAFTHLLFLFYT